MVVRRGGHEFVGVALFREYAQTKRAGGLMAQWATRPAGMLAKCAEALALRKAFPLDLAGIYSDDEMAQADSRRSRQQSALGEALAAADLNDLPGETVDGEVIDKVALSPYGMPVVVVKVKQTTQEGEVILTATAEVELPY